MYPYNTNSNNKNSIYPHPNTNNANTDFDALNNSRNINNLSSNSLEKENNEAPSLQPFKSQERHPDNRPPNLPLDRPINRPPSPPHPDGSRPPIPPPQIRIPVPPRPPERPPGGRPIDRKVVDMLNDAIRDEAKAAIFYRDLADRLRNPSDKETVRRIQMDELKHKKLLEDILYHVTGSRPGILSTESYEANKNYEQYHKNNFPAEQFEDHILNNINSMEFYRKLLFSFLNQDIRDMLFEIMIDKMAHSTKLGYLYSKYNKTN